MKYNKIYPFVTPQENLQERDLKKKRMEKFIAYLKSKGLSNPTIKRYLEYWRLFDKVLEDEDLTQEIINQFLMDHSSQTARSFMKNLLDTHGVSNQYMIPKLTGRKKRVKRQTINIRRAKVIRTWLYHNKNFRFLLCFDLSYQCALRRAEVMAIHISDFDLERWVENPKKPCRLKIKGKGNKERIVIVPSKLMHIIIDYLKENSQLTERLFPFNFTKWHDAFKEAIRSVGMEYNFTLHDLRRARATIWMEEGLSAIKIKDRLGHSNIQTTMLYVNPDEEKGLQEWEDEF